MILGAIVVYGLLVWILWLMRQETRGLDHDALLVRATDVHHRVHAMITAHPRGGTWRETLRWMEEAGSGH